MANANYGTLLGSALDPMTDETDVGGSTEQRAPVDVAPSAREITPYEAVSSQAAIQTTPDGETVFKLDWNEATIPASPKAREAIADYLTGDRGLNWYPRLGSDHLCEALSEYTGVSADHLMVTNGSDDGLGLICRTYLDRGDEVVAPVPSYNHFMVFAQSRGADIVKPVGDDPFGRNWSSIYEAASDETRMIYLVSPNNPTGVVYPPDEIAELCRTYPDTLVVVDEAYFEFSQVTAIDLVGKCPNLVVTRTFSKAFGLAGLRVGYLAAHPDIVDGLGRLYNPKSVNTLGQIGAAAALDDLEYLHDYLDEVEQSKRRLAAFFADRDADCQVTSANFVVVRVDDLQTTLQTLEDRGVYVRDRSDYPGLDGCLRMTVGTVEQTERLLERIDDVF